MQRILSLGMLIAVFCLLTTGCTHNPAGELLELELEGVKWKFHWCPAGTFTIGSPESEKGRNRDETQHKVTLTQGFYMAETECTQEQWEAMMRNNPSEFKGAKLPVEMVSWNDCQEFIEKLNELKVAPAGFKFALLTEAQWEYACRAGSKTAYCFGDDAGKLGDYAWYRGDNRDNRVRMHHPVGTKKPNTWGLYDMHGNILEWCQDWCGDYPKGNVVDPVGVSSGDFRVFRGGSWNNGTAEGCRSACRSYTDDFAELRLTILGLRVALLTMTNGRSR